jgi:hypothetical protein
MARANQPSTAREDELSSKTRPARFGPAAGRVLQRAGPVLAFLLTSVGPGFAGAPEPSNIATDETVVVLPTAARLDPVGDQWIIPLHAWVFEREPDSIWRTNALRMFADWLNLPDGSEANRYFQERAQDFLVDNESAKRLELIVDGRHSVSLPRTGSNGHARTETELPIADLPPADGNPWLSAAVVLDEGDHRRL